MSRIIIYTDDNGQVANIDIEGELAKRDDPSASLCRILDDAKRMVA